MMELKVTSRFKKDYKRCKKRKLDLRLLQNVIDTLLAEEPLDEKYRDHALTGNHSGFRECHIQPDWLLIYKIEGNNLILLLSATGTHSDLFDL